VDSCLEVIDSSYWQEVEAKISSGQIEFSSGAARECLELLTSEACQARDTPLQEALDQACLDGFAGAGETGEVCIVNEECASGVCIFAPGQGDDVCDLGQCAELATTDQDCAGAPCSVGLYCDGLDTTCQPLVAVGGECAQLDACVPGAVCDAGVCARQGDPDGACNAELGFRACRRFDYWCDPSDSLCKQRVAAGGSCDVDIDECNLDSVCIDSECRLLPGPGEGCDPGVGCAGDSLCEDGLCLEVTESACSE
ncbi:MAG: hypothetical protein KJO07_22305, partial [Deltaproteobacteria bacterium]|nr:hypothetical protein [Deltaproteobacteria bacterium]